MQLCSTALPFFNRLAVNLQMPGVTANVETNHEATSDNTHSIWSRCQTMAKLGQLGGACLWVSQALCAHSAVAIRSISVEKRKVYLQSLLQPKFSEAGNHGEAPEHPTKGILRNHNCQTNCLKMPIVKRRLTTHKLKGEGNTVLSTTGEPGTLKGTNPSVTATSPLTLWGSASHALFSALEPKQ